MNGNKISTESKEAAEESIRKVEEVIKRAKEELSSS